MKRVTVALRDSNGNVTNRIPVPEDAAPAKVVVPKKSAMKTGQAVVVIPAPDLRLLQVRLRGVGDGLLVHAFGPKSLKHMTDQTTGVAQGPRGPRDLHEEYRDSRYVLDEKKGQFGFPAGAFKDAAVEACRYVEGLSMSYVTGAFFVLGKYVLIEGKPEEHHAVVKIGLKKDIAQERSRALFPKWETTLTIRYDAGIIQPAQIINLLNRAGFGVGVGEWRPEKRGTYGMFEVVLNWRPRGTGRA